MQQSRQKGRILVVDDEEAHAQVIAEGLERVGYDCVAVTSGNEAIKLLKGANFDVIVTDLVMDGADGMEVLYGQVVRRDGRAN